MIVADMPDDRRRDMGLAEIYNNARYSCAKGYYKINNDHSKWKVHSPNEHSLACDTCHQSRPDLAAFERVLGNKEVNCKHCYVRIHEYA